MITRSVRERYGHPRYGRVFHYGDQRVEVSNKYQIQSHSVILFRAIHPNILRRLLQLEVQYHFDHPFSYNDISKSFPIDLVRFLPNKNLLPTLNKLKNPKEISCISTGEINSMQVLVQTGLFTVNHRRLPRRSTAGVSAGLRTLVALVDSLWVFNGISRF